MNFSVGSLNKKNLLLSLKSADTGNNRFSKPAVIRFTAVSHVWHQNRFFASCDHRHSCFPRGGGHQNRFFASCDYRHSCFPRGDCTRTGTLLAVITGTAVSHEWWWHQNRFFASCDYRHSCFPRGGGARTGSLLAVIGTAVSHVVVATEPVLC